MLKWDEKTVSIEFLKDFEKNPRKITPKQLETLKKAIENIGYHHPIACQPDGTIISGHQRAKCLVQLGYKNIRVTIPNRPLTEAEFTQMLVQTNVNNGETDWDIMVGLADKEDMLDWGIDEKELMAYDKAIQMHGNTDPDDVLEIQEKTVSVLGDLWTLRNHRLICGDSTQADVVAKLLGSVKPHLMVTDPPYGVKYDASWRVDAKRADGKPIGFHALGKVENDDRADWRETWALFPGNIAYVWHAGLFSSVVAESLEAAGFKIRSQIIWAKNRFAIGRGDYHWQHEPCWYAVKGTGNWQGDRKQSTLWQIDKPQKSETGHSTQKPVECMRRPILNNSSVGQAIYEPFCGSGTTIIAAEETGRHCYAVELSPQYVDVIIRRWQAFTGLEAVHENGKKFSEVENDGIRTIACAAG